MQNLLLHFIFRAPWSTLSPSLEPQRSPIVISNSYILTVFYMNTTVLYCSCFEPVIPFSTHRIIPWYIIHVIDHTKWRQTQLWVVILRLLLYVLPLFPLTFTYTHILTVLWLYKVNSSCNTSSSLTPLLKDDHNTYE